MIGTMLASMGEAYDTGINLMKGASDPSDGESLQGEGGLYHQYEQVLE